jgi:predicted phage terminase large subunit-like protein
MLMEKLARGGKAIIDSEKYQRIFDVPLLIDQSATTNFANNFGGVREGVTVRGSVTGLHAHMVIFDDALDAGTKALSEQEKKVTNYWINATASSRTKDATRTAFIMVGQRICLNDPQSTWRKHADMGLPVRIISLPATTEGRVEPAHLIDIYADDGTLIPDRLPHSELHKKRIVMGDAAYSAQFLQRPISAGTKIFRIDRLKFDIAPSRFKCIVRYWDKAGTLNAGCNTAGVLVAIDYSDRVWILDSVAFQLEPFERNQRIRFVAEIDGQDVPIRFEIEGSSGGKESFQNSVRGLHGWEVTGEYPKGDKGVRAGPFAAQVNAGNVHIAQKLTQDGWVNPVWADSFLEELNNFTGPKSTGLKDQVDAASAGYAFLTEDSGHVAGGLFNNG